MVNISNSGGRAALRQFIRAGQQELDFCPGQPQQSGPALWGSRQLRLVTLRLMLPIAASFQPIMPESVSL